MARDITPPNAALFDADPLEQIYAKGTLSPNLAGLSGLMMYAMGKQADSRREDYLGSLSSSNALQADISRVESANKMREQRMKETGPLLQHGFDRSHLAGADDLLTPGTGDDPVTAMIRAELQAKTFAHMQAGNKGAGKESTTVQTQQAPFGPGMTTITSKGVDPATAYAKNQEVLKRLTADAMANPRNYTDKQKAYIISQSNNRNPGIED